MLTGQPSPSPDPLSPRHLLHSESLLRLCSRSQACLSLPLPGSSSPSALSKLPPLSPSFNFPHLVLSESLPLLAPAGEVLLEEGREGWPSARGKEARRIRVGQPAQPY
eukprot:2656592-Rhodomonas_salina.3